MKSISIWNSISTLTAYYKSWQVASEDEDNLVLPAHFRTPDVPDGNDRFDGNRKCAHLGLAEGIIRAKERSSESSIRTRLKPLRQDARIRSTKDATKMVSTNLYKSRKADTNPYRIWHVYTYRRPLCCSPVQIRRSKATGRVLNAKVGTDTL